MLDIYIGPMFAGKTSQLIHMFNTNPESNKIIIDYHESTDCFEGILMNHDKVKQSAIKASRLYDICRTSRMDNTTAEFYKFNPLIDAHSIYINEAQFFPDLFEFVLEHIQTKHIYIYGLDGDFEQKKIGSILELIPYCDSVTKLNGQCSRCHKKSIFSKRITESKEQYLLDEHAYIPLCRICFYIV
jgi:thymidine kinase